MNHFVRGFGIFLILISFLPRYAFAEFQVEVSEAPTSNLALTVSAIKSAHQSIQLNIYEMTSPEIADALMSQIRAGVHVEILEEGQPVGGMSATGKGIEAQIVQSMGQSGTGNHFYVMTSKETSAKRRFHFDHAKYAVIDNAHLLIGSENYSPTGNPAPGTKGNRGWEVFIHNQAIARDFQNIFAADTTLGFGDIIDATKSIQAERNKPGNPVAPLPASPDYPLQGTTLSALAVQRITAPDSSLAGLVALLDQARSSIDIQQMTFDSAWSVGPNPLITALENAAKRGVRVRVLLNDESVFQHPGRPEKSKNQATIDRLNQIANISAKIANLKAMGVDYIHNKGALVDGNLTLISSINWNENAIQRNREAAVLIKSPAVFAHYEALFESDWRVSAGNTAENPANLFFPESRANALQTGLAPAVDCPNSLVLSVEIGKLKLNENEESFASLSESKISSTFHRVHSREGCILENSEPALSIARRQYVEIKNLPGDSIAFSLEGYTPVGNKLFSVRSKIAKNANLTGSFTGGVYSGSTAHGFLGTAKGELQRRDLFFHIF